MEPFRYRKRPNSLLLNCLLPKRAKIEEIGFENKEEIPESITSNLGMISGLYLYTGTPPLGYGTQAPKVAETVSRAYKFNKKKQNKTITIFNIPIERLHWEKQDGKFPFNEIHGNFSVRDTMKMCCLFLQKNQATIDNIVDRVMEELSMQNSDILTKGKQTFCPFAERSLTAAQAYRNMYDFFVSNGAPTTMSTLEWIKQFFILFEKPSICFKERREDFKETLIWDDENKQKILVKKPYSYMAEARTTCKEDTQETLIHIATSFASYLKHKERGKKDRRAIASANMIMRMFLHIIESFHLELGKVLDGSTISIGGEEKKAKITTNFQIFETSLTGEKWITQGTEDATKWNECLAPACFAAMHHYLFDSACRNHAMVPQATEWGKLFSQIAIAGNFLMSMKRIQLGPGVQIQNTKFYRRISWNDIDIQLCSEETQRWYNEVKHLLVGNRKYLLSSPGMLMGMLNAGSTTLGLLPSNYRMNPQNMCVVTLRSSDDSMTKYIAATRELNEICISKHRQNLELIGINLSKDKTFYFRAGFGEYTSWYMDESFVAQFGVETASLKPEGINPADDFYAVARQTATSLQTLTINHIGAEAKLRLGLEGVRRLWRINKNYSKRRNISPEVQLLSDGGMNIWNVANCHLQEIPLKERYCKTEEEQNYLLKCQNPNNPFSEQPREELTYSKEHGCLQLMEIEVPRTIFHFLKMSNRSVNKDESKKRAEEEIAFGEAASVAKFVDPTLSLDIPNVNTSIASHLYGILETEAHDVDLDEEEAILVAKAMEYLNSGNRPVEDEENYESDFSDL